MSPLNEDVAAQLAKRYYYYCPTGYIFVNGECEYNAWAYWGRWVLTSVVILGIGILLMVLGCLSARRRRRQGMAPMYGTGWMGGKYQGGPPHQQQNGYYAPPPQYSAQPMPGQYTGSTFNPNDGYYGAQTQGVQPPPNAYVPPHRDSPGAGGDDVPPPAARPSGK